MIGTSYVLMMDKCPSLEYRMLCVDKRDILVQIKMKQNREFVLYAYDTCPSIGAW